MTLRPAQPGDAAACAAILREWIEETPWFPRLQPPAADIRFIAAKVAANQVIVAGARPRGFLALEGSYISCLYVARAYRSAGMGAALLDYAKTQAGELRLWTFQANTRAQAFYLREGFVEGSRTEGDNEEELPDVEFVWTAGGTS